MNIVSHLRLLICLMMGLVWGGAALASDDPIIRAAVLKIGTVNWELDTIKRNGFDTAAGFTLQVQSYADNAATRIAFAGGAADLAVADWIWVARQRAAGKDYVFIPYSKAVGAVVVPKDSPIQSVEQLVGKKIGIAGGPLDKSWLIMQAFARKTYDLDLADQSEQVFGAPPLIFKSALQGKTDATINFWHFLAKMKAAGMRELISVKTAATALGLNPDTPLLGYVMKESFISENPGVAEAMYQASRASKELLAASDAAWEPLRDMMNAQSDAQFEALRADFRKGIPVSGGVDAADAAQFLALMAELGGEKLVGGAAVLPDGLFAVLE